MVVVSTPEGQYFQQQHGPYALRVHPPHYPAKYNQPYSPSYHYPSPNAPVFTPSWQQQQQQPIEPPVPQEPSPESEATAPPLSVQKLHLPHPCHGIYINRTRVFPTHLPQLNYKMGHLVLQTPKPHTRTQHHHNPVRRLRSSHRPRISKHYRRPHHLFHLHGLRFFRLNLRSYLRLCLLIPSWIFRSSCCLLMRLLHGLLRRIRVSVFECDGDDGYADANRLSCVVAYFVVGC